MNRNIVENELVQFEVQYKLYAGSFMAVIRINLMRKNRSEFRREYTHFYLRILMYVTEKVKFKVMASTGLSKSNT
jgi:hypothetical protein